MFDEVEPDSADEDFEHEYEDICQKNNPDNDLESNDSNQFAHLAEVVRGQDAKVNQTEQ